MKKKCICVCIDSAGLYIYFGIKAIVKLLEKKMVLHPSLITELYRDAKVVIESDEERSPSMAPLPFPLEKPQEPKYNLQGL